MLDLNYVIGDDGQVSASAVGSVLQSATITTSGFPVQITVTGDAEPASGGWHRLQIFRDSTAIGEILHIEAPAANKNMTVSLSVIDNPVAGVYTYSVKIVGSSGLTATYTEVGQLYMIVEEKVVTSYNAMSWLRRDIVPPTVYYGYNNDMNASDSDSSWSIKKVTVSGTVETVKWTNGSYDRISTWSNRVASFTTPSGSLGLTASSTSTNNSYGSNFINISWNLLSGVDIYNIYIYDSNSNLLDEKGGYLYSNGNFNNQNSSVTIYNKNNYLFTGSELNNTYSITLIGKNVGGTTQSTVTIAI